MKVLRRVSCTNYPTQSDDDDMPDLDDEGEGDAADAAPEGKGKGKAVETMLGEEPSKPKMEEVN